MDDGINNSVLLFPMNQTNRMLAWFSTNHSNWKSLEPIRLEMDVVSFICYVNTYEIVLDNEDNGGEQMVLSAWPQMSR